MFRAAAPTALTALLALTSCFQINPIADCTLLCAVDVGCPGSMTCMPQSGLTQGLCTSMPNKMCPSLQNHDAGGTDAEVGMSGPPSMLCHNGSCLTLPEDVRSNLVLLLWPSNLPAVGSPVSVWADQSGQANDAHALSTTGSPHVIADGVQLDSAEAGAGFVVINSPTLDFGSGDFAVVVVAGLSSSTTPVTFLRKWDGLRTNSRQIAIDWVRTSAAAGQPQGTVDDTAIPGNLDISQPSVEAYGLYRSTDHVALQVNGVTVGSADLPTAGLSTSNPDDLYLGVGNMFSTPADSIEAVVAIRGTVGSTQLSQLGDFLRAVFMKSSP